jgi:hypothetical protein
MNVARLDFKKGKVMWNEAHSKTVIGTLRDEFEAYRREQGWSREALAIHIVDAHVAIGADILTGVTFDSGSKDAFNQAKAHCERISRWLDDVNKDNNLLGSNMLPTMLAALPENRRLHVLNQILRPLGVAARIADELPDDAAIDPRDDLKSVAKESGEAVVALADVREGAPVEVLQTALREVEEAEEASRRAARDIRSFIARAGRSAVAKLRSVG